MNDALLPPWELKPVRAGTCARVHPELLAPRNRLDALRVHSISLAGRVVEVDGGKLYATDFLVITMLQRTFGVLDALIDAVDSFNLHAAAPLLRLQLDTLFRANYLATCGDSDALSMRILGGTQFRQIKDAEKKPLNDGRLKDLAAENHPWAGAVYDQTSGWVHLSVNHMMTTIRAGEGDAFEIQVPLPRDLAPSRIWLEVLEAACQATEEFFGWVELWEANKGLPPGQTRDITAS